MNSIQLKSRATVLTTVLLSGLLWLTACSGIIQPTAQENRSTDSTPTTAAPSGNANTACVSPAAQTPALTEGPFFKTGSPERTSLLEPGMAGTKLVLSGRVLGTDCQPIAGAMLDFWQADANGQYDNAGYTLRGHQFTDPQGKYQLTTIVPALYPGRTEHIHVKVQAPGGPVLTTQLFFPGVASNQTDAIFNPALLVNAETTTDGMQATFDFVVGAK